MGLIRRGKYPRIGEIIDEFADSASKSPGRAEEFGDDIKDAVVRAEKNIDLFLNHHAFRVGKQGDEIISVDAIDTRSNELRRFSGQLFADCTGHGTIGALADADSELTPVGRMGMSNMRTWDEVEGSTEFPATPWALQLNMEDFPYPRDHHGQWFWESGFDKDPLGDAEGIRDWNLRAVYGAFNAMKNGDGAADHKNAMLTWVAYIGGPRESLRLMGEVVGKAASTCTQYDCSPRQVYEQHLSELTQLLDLPGKASRQQVGGEVTIPADALPKATPYGPADEVAAGGKRLSDIPGVVVDEAQAKRTGEWTLGSGLKGFVEAGYQYASADGKSTATFNLTAPASSKFAVRIAWGAHENRGTRVPVDVQLGGNSVYHARVNMRQSPGDDGFGELTQLQLRQGDVVSVNFSTVNAGGFVHIDAVQLLPVK